MAFTWIYDLDLTLYDYSGNMFRDFNYNNMIFNKELKKNIKRLPGKKVLFTNANLLHTLACIKKMKLERTFHKVSCRELTGFKPNIKSYVTLYKICDIELDDTCYFFEDTLENLETAKTFGWNTVYIGSDSKKIKMIENGDADYVDYVFHNITNALNYFNDLLNE